jgi:peptidoglycan/xylan/chitin deacetylase (PgdA/CDA1 family)
MTLRSQVRSLLIRTASLARADEIAMRMQSRKHHAWGIVVAMHETPAALEAQFRRQLEWVSQFFTISNLQALAEFWQNPEPDLHAKPSILFTFDDGRESNYTIAAPLLESFGGRGLFFIVPAFTECSPDQALAFFRSRINPNSRPGDEAWEDWKPMRRDQIADLAERGHAIGNHTLTHHRLAGLSDAELEREIGDSARTLACWTGKPVEAFAWTFGCDSVDAKALHVIARHHRFCFSPCAGVIDGHDSPHLLWRREIEVKYSPAEYRFLYSGLVDPWWSTRRRRLNAMLRASQNGQPQNERQTHTSTRIAS